MRPDSAGVASAAVGTLPAYFASRLSQSLVINMDSIFWIEVLLLAHGAEPPIHNAMPSARHRTGQQ